MARLPPEMKVRIFEYVFGAVVMIPLGAFCHLKTGQIELLRFEKLDATADRVELKSFYSLSFVDKATREEAAAVFWRAACPLVEIYSKAALIADARAVHPSLLLHIDRVHNFYILLYTRDPDESDLLANLIAAGGGDDEVRRCEQCFMFLRTDREGCWKIKATQSLNDGQKANTPDILAVQEWARQFVGAALPDSGCMTVLAFTVLMLKIATISEGTALKTEVTGSKELRAAWKALDAEGVGKRVAADNFWLPLDHGALFGFFPLRFDGSVNVDTELLERRKRLEEGKGKAKGKKKGGKAKGGA